MTGSLGARSFLGLKRLLKRALVILELDRISAVLCVFAMDIVIVGTEKESLPLGRLSLSMVLELDRAGRNLATRPGCPACRVLASCVCR